MAIHLIVLLITIFVAIGYFFQALVSHVDGAAMQEAQ